MAPRTVLVLICAAGIAAVQAQSTQSRRPANPLSTVLKGQYDGVIELVVRAAEKMPEANYGFRPTPDVRSFAELVAHIVSNNLIMCSASLGEPIPPPAADLTSEKTTKEELLQALRVAIAYCSRAYTTTDEQLAQSVSERRVNVRLQPLVWNSEHNYEHYGNMATYMRMKGLVPPSSERPEIEERLQGTEPRQ